MADSMDMPDDVRRVLSKLNDQAAPVVFSEIERVLKAELGDWDSISAHIDSEPFGNGIPVRAHAARLLDGTPVVVVL